MEIKPINENEQPSNVVTAEEYDKTMSKRGRPVNDNAKYKRDDYREYKKAYAKEYYSKNKEKVMRSMKKEAICQYCKSVVCRTNLRPHYQSNKCRKTREINVVPIQPANEDIIHEICKVEPIKRNDNIEIIEL